MTLYALGDIHGHPDELDRALGFIEADGGRDAHVIFVGDYADRGPDSRGVIDRLIAGHDAGRTWTCLRGNHDRMFEWFMESPPRHDPHLLVGYYWLHERLGGDTTLASYGVEVHAQRRLKDVHADALEAVPAAHVEFLKRLTLTYETDELFFCHAGVRPRIPLAEQNEEDLIWIRQEFVNDATPHPKLIVHGHTPADTAEHRGNRVNLDGGAGYGRPLVPVAFEGHEAFTLTETGRMPLEPQTSR